MEERVEIVFHNLEPSAAIEKEIRERVARLERLYDRMTACRVSVEALHKQHRTGNVYEVHIDLLLPGGEVAVSKQPQKAKERYANPDVYTSIKDAFKAAERRLKEFKRRQSGETKYHEPLFLGQIAELNPEQDFGYLLNKDGALLYFNRNAVYGADLEELKRGDSVRYVEANGETGPTAVRVWRASDTEFV